MKIIELEDEEFDEIAENYIFRSDDSYTHHTADLIWKKIKEQYPDLLKEIWDKEEQRLDE